jgi:hypothetical protein
VLGSNGDEMLRFVCIAGLFLTIASTAAHGAKIADCGASAGYGYFPKAGHAAAAPDSGKWISDAISGGRFSLTENDGEFDLLVTDAMGRVFSSKQEGAKVTLVGSSYNSVTVVVAYPLLVETYTFLRNEDGQAEAIWTTNKWGTPIPKVAAFRADCSFFAR